MSFRKYCWCKWQINRSWTKNSVSDWNKAGDTIKHMWITMLLCPTSSIQNKVFPCCSAVSVDFLLLSMEIMFMVLFAVFRCNFLLNNVIEKILLLIRRAERYLVVGAVRFIRTILSRHVSIHLCRYCDLKSEYSK